MVFLDGRAVVLLPPLVSAGELWYRPHRHAQLSVVGLVELGIPLSDRWLLVVGVEGPDALH